MSVPEGISAREAEVLALVRDGSGNAEIADRLFISVRTVESHVSSLLRKCGVADRRRLAEVAARLRTEPPAADGLAALPVPRTTFVGRQRERESVLAALADARLVTLVGPGGVGKTRLAIEVAGGLACGGAFVDLVPVRDGSVAQAVAAALDVTPNSHQSLVDAIVQRIGNERALLAIDNCEHLLDTVAMLAEQLISRCPAVTILATSRERVGVPGERVVPVPPLPPEPDGRALFHDRAAAADPGFAADPAVVGELCARLDGVPLAIELAAARSRSLGVAGLRAALSDPLRLVSGGRGADERHRSLRAVLGWSYGLLEADEQALLRRLSVFAGGFDLDAAVHVSASGDLTETADLIGRLVDKSLVVRSRDADRWYLLGTVRAFARELLETDPSRAEAFDRYLDWARSVAAALADRLDEQWRHDFEAVAADLSAALLGCPPGTSSAAHELARALGRLAFARRFLADSLRYYQQAAVRAPDPAEAARDLWSAAHCALIGPSPGRLVLDLLHAAAERAHAAGDGDMRAIALARLVEVVNRFDGSIASDLTAERLHELLDEARAAGNPSVPTVAAAIAVAAAWNGTGRRFEPDRELAAEAAEAARTTAAPPLVSAGLDLLGTVAAKVGDLQEARRVGRERLELLPLLDRTDPEAALEIEDTFHMAATTALQVGDLPAAADVARRMADDDLLGHRSRNSVSTLVPALLLVGEHAEALRHADDMWEDWQRAGRPPSGQVASGAAFAMLGHGLLGDRETSQRWRMRIRELADCAGIDSSRLASVVFTEARLAIHLGETAAAAELVERASAGFAAFRFDAYAHAAGAELAVIAGLPDAGERVAAATEATTGNAWAAACLARARGRLQHDAGALAEAVTVWTEIGARFERAYTLTLLPGHEAEAHTELDSLGVPTRHG